MIAPVGVTYLVVVMQLHRVPLAVADSTWDVWRHCGLCLAWTAKRGKEKNGIAEILPKRFKI